VPSDAQAELVRVEREGQTDYDVYLPSSYTEHDEAGKKWPVLVAFHWSTGRSTSMLKLWEKAAERYGVILALPNSRYRRKWIRSDGTDADDMIARIKTSYAVDDKRIYATGFSAGANFAYRMMVTRPGLFRGVGPFGGRFQHKRGELERLDPNRTRMCIFHGRQDKTIKYKYAVRAADTLARAGFKVRTRTYNQGHWLRRDYAETMWNCLDQPSEQNDT
jgi:predicted esterase